MGKRAPLFAAGWEWDGKAGSDLVDGMGWDYTILLWNGTGRETIGERR